MPVASPSLGLGLRLDLVVVRVLQDHVLDLHQARGVRALVLLELHGDILDVPFEVGDHDVFQRVDAAARLFDVLREQEHSLLRLRQLEHLRQDTAIVSMAVSSSPARRAKP